MVYDGWAYWVTGSSAQQIKRAPIDLSEPEQVVVEHPGPIADIEVGDNFVYFIDSDGQIRTIPR